MRVREQFQLLRYWVELRRKVSRSADGVARPDAVSKKYKRGRPSLISPPLLAYIDDHLAEVAAAFQVVVSVGCLLKMKNTIDDRMDFGHD